MLAIATSALAVPTDETTLEFDLAADDAVVEEHTARLLWNLTTDNIVPDRVGSVSNWNSLYLDRPAAVSGRVVADLEAGTITGDIIERWSCNNDCLSNDGTSSWTTTRDTGWTATITNGVVDLGTDAWVVEGSVAIKYKADVTAVESPSECDGSPCYICVEQLCRVGGEATVTVPLEGWIDGETLSLSFVDKLQRNIAQMDFSGLRTTEFFMSRFSITITGAVVPVAGERPPEEPVDTEPEATPPPAVDNGATDLPAGAIIPGLDAGSPPSEFGDDAGAGATAATPPTQKDRVGIATLAAIFILVLGGVAAVLIAGFLVRRLMGWNDYEAAVDTARAEGLRVSPDAPTGWKDELDRASKQLADMQPGYGPTPVTIKATPTEHYASQRGLKPGRYRRVEFTKPVHLERQMRGGNVELLTTQFTGPILVGDPDPARPWRTPVFTNDGMELGYVRTSDLPAVPGLGQKSSP